VKELQPPAAETEQPSGRVPVPAGPGELGDVKYMGISQDLIDNSMVLLGFMYKGMALPPPLKTLTSILLTYIKSGVPHHAIASLNASSYLLENEGFFFFFFINLIIH
jgi:hypothetical protein